MTVCACVCACTCRRVWLRHTHTHTHSKPWNLAFCSVTEMKFAEIEGRGSNSDKGPMVPRDERGPWKEEMRC
jgi:hypothetical protein